MDVPDAPNGFWTWLLAAIGAAVSAVFGVLTKALHTMYMHEKQSNKEAIAKLEAKLEAACEAEKKCQEQHELLAVQVAKLQTRLEHLEAKSH